MMYIHFKNDKFIHIKINYHACINAIVTGFGKTVSTRTRIEIHFIAYYNSHTQGLSRHSDTVAIDKKVCFYRWLFANPMKPC